MLKSLAKIRSWFTTGRPVTAGYDPGPSALIYANWHRRPPWSYYYADIMLLDPQIWFGINIGNGPLMSAKVEIKTESAELKQFIGEQWDRLWSRSAHQILRAKHYGFLACEMVCKEVDGRLEFDYMRDFHPIDVGALKVNGARVGVRVRNIHAYNKGVVDLYGPKALWITYGEEFSRIWGRAILERCYQPWFDKNSDGGALDLRRLHGFKDAWIGDQIRYPMREFNTPSGQKVHGRDLAREVAENRQSGGVMALPSTRDADGNPEWEYIAASGTGGQTAIPDWIHDLDWDILDGLLVPREVVEAGGQGGGWSGRSVPFIGFLSTRDQEFAAIVRAVRDQFLMPLAMANGGPAARDFDLVPVPLIETVGEQVGDMGKPELSKQAGDKEEGGEQPQQLRGKEPDGQGGEREDAEQFSIAHAPAGGITIGGEDFTGGEFIPGKTLAKATPKEKSALKIGAKKKSAEADIPAVKTKSSSTTDMHPARREGKGKEARLVLADGKPAPEHIKPSMVPPQWTDVHVSTDPKADVLVRARDAKGRLKTVYSDNFTMRQAANKFSRVNELVSKRHEISEQNQKNRKSDDAKTREAADCLWLIEEQATRPGSDSDTKAKVKAYGATTLRAEHVEQDEDGSVRLHFIGKEGIEHNHRIRNPELAKMLVSRKQTADKRGGKLFATSDTALRDYTRSLDGGEFTPKDFRTAKATVLAADEIRRLGGCCRDKKEYKAAVKQVATAVSSVLGNRPQQAVESYINPVVWSAWQCPDCGTGK